MNRDEFIRVLLQRAKEAGFEAAEACCDESESFSVDVYQEEIRSYEFSQSIGLGLRGLKDGRMGVASTQILDEESIDMLVHGAMENLRLIESEDEEFFYPGDAEYPIVQTSYPQMEAYTAAEKIRMAKELEKLALAADERIARVSMALICTESFKRTICNTLGLNIRREGNNMAGAVSVVAQSGEESATGMDFFCALHPEEICLEQIARSATDKALLELTAVRGESMQTPVIFAPVAARSMWSTFISVFSAKAAQKDLSLLKGREGEAIAAECVTLRDDPLMLGGYGSRPFDDEGVAAVTRNIVDKGVLTTLMHNLKTAHKQGVVPTGHASRSYASAGTVAPSNFYLVPGEYSPEALERKMCDGLVVTAVTGLHAGANAISGDFSLSAKGYCVRGGARAEAVKQITVSGNFYRMLKDVEAVGSDLCFGMPGASCYGSPSFLVARLDVAGK